MKRRRILALVLVSPFAFATVAGAAPVTRTAPPFVDGFYSINGHDTTTVDAELFVGANGKIIVGGTNGSGVCCAPSATAEASGAAVTLCFYFPRSIAISAGGTFSYSGEVLTSMAQSGLSAVITGTATFSGHFIKGKIVAHKTNALIGTFSSPSMCAPSTPTRVIDQWDINNK